MATGNIVVEAGFGGEHGVLDAGDVAEDVFFGLVVACEECEALDFGVGEGIGADGAEDGLGFLVHLVGVVEFGDEVEEFVGFEAGEEWGAMFTEEFGAKFGVGFVVAGKLEDAVDGGGFECELFFHAGGPCDGVFFVDGGNGDGEDAEVVVFGEFFCDFSGPVGGGGFAVFGGCEYDGLEGGGPVAGVFLGFIGVFAVAVEATGGDVEFLEFVVVGAAGCVVFEDGFAGGSGGVGVGFLEGDGGAPLVFGGFLELAEFFHGGAEVDECGAGVWLGDVAVVFDEACPGGGLFFFLAVLAVALAYVIECGGGEGDIVGVVVEDILVGFDGVVAFVEFVEATAEAEEDVGVSFAIRELEGEGFVGGVGALVVGFQEEFIGVFEVDGLEGVEF